MSAAKRKCPTPKKVRYKTERDALAALRMPFRHVIKPPTRQYRCRGGHWHLTTKA